MDAGDQTPAARGRARGRARSLLPEEPQGGAVGGQVGEVVQEGVYGHIYGDNRSSDGSNGNGAGSNGNGNGAGSDGNGNGDGNSGNGNGAGNNGNGNGGGNGGSPRGVARGGNGDTDREAARERALLSDYIESKPEGFIKKGTMPHRSLPPPTIVSNYYAFRTHPEFRMRMYSIRVEPAVEEEKHIRSLIYNHREQLGSYMCTGLVLFTTRPIRPEALVYNSNLRNAPDVDYTVTIEFVREVHNTEGTVFQFYNVVVRQMQRMMNFELLGRHFFDPDHKVPFSSWRLELWPGFQNSIRQQDGGLMLNVESVWKVLQTTNVLQMMSTIRGDNPGNFEPACRAAIENMMVITVYNKKAYKISRIDFNSTPRSTFETKDGPISYLDYYKNKYDITIRAEGQPMLVSEPRRREFRGGQQGDIYLVPELCFPCGLNEELRSNFRLMRDLARCLHMPPNERVSTMQNFIDGVNRNDQILSTLRNWGIRVNTQPVEFQARYLNSEEILVGGNQRVAPDDKADWTNAFRSQRMLTAMRLSTWVIIATQRDFQGIGNLVGTMQRVAGPLGYQIQQPQTKRAGDARGIPQIIGEAMADNQGKLDLVFVILPNNNADNYAAVKKRCSIEFGIPSQCFLSKHLNNPKGLMSICTKMVIQMNAKQGGEPWGVVNPLRNTMVLGYDVHHAGPGGGSSIGAMCATVSESLGKYFSCVSKIQADREEVATTISGMFEKCLKAYSNLNGVLPARIFMFRDGVGEGQLRAVYDQEIQAFKDRIKATYKPGEATKLTYVVVNKRINTRFFHKQNQQFQNPRPGLIVDDYVTRPERYDYFLISQTARQGCVGPTYYNVLLDENGLPPDRLQMYTYKLCHLYYNWSGTVAVPAPCQNAHKLAFQVGTALKRPSKSTLDYLLHFL